MHSMPGEALLACLVWVQVRARRESGQTLAEYGLLIGVVAVGAVIVGIIAFRNTLSFGIDQMTNCLNGGCGG